MVTIIEIYSVKPDPRSALCDGGPDAAYIGPPWQQWLPAAGPELMASTLAWVHTRGRLAGQTGWE
jgi:hypothetical protein